MVPLSPASLFRIFIGILILVTQFATSLNREHLDESIPAFSDGEWKGVFSMVTSSTTDVTDIVTSYKGELGFFSAGGTLDGEWTMNGTSSYAGDITGFAKFTAEHAGGEIRVKPDEITDAGWFAADALPEIPPPISIARQLIDWFAMEHR